uniref:Secreted protein n=1 Tax=Steinernema glaseri TaxID=37863 RepID=A0A1I8AS07_9BILA
MFCSSRIRKFTQAQECTLFSLVCFRAELTKCGVRRRQIKEMQKVHKMRTDLQTEGPLDATAVSSLSGRW